MRYIYFVFIIIMKKQEVQQRVLQNGKPIDLAKFNWCELTNTFSTLESNLVLDFSNIDDCTFKTGDYCTLTTGDRCTFKTEDSCTFATGSDCTFTTWSYCTFTTEDDCTFTTEYSCTFATRNNCTFRTEDDCTFKTGDSCTFKTEYSCTFTTGSECVCVRKDIFEFFQIPINTTIKLNGYEARGFEILEKKKLRFKIEKIIECESEQEAQKLLKEGESVVLID